MTTQEKIAVMQAHEDGKKIEFRLHGKTQWIAQPCPIWNWVEYEYHVKPEDDLRPYDWRRKERFEIDDFNDIEFHSDEFPRSSCVKTEPEAKQLQEICELQSLLLNLKASLGDTHVFEADADNYYVAFYASHRIFTAEHTDCLLTSGLGVFFSSAQNAQKVAEYLTKNYKGFDND